MEIFKNSVRQMIHFKYASVRLAGTLEMIDFAWIPARRNENVNVNKYFISSGRTRTECLNTRFTLPTLLKKNIELKYNISQYVYFLHYKLVHNSFLYVIKI